MLFNLLADNTNIMPMVLLIGFVVIIIVMSVINNKKRKQQVAQDQERKDRLCKGTTIITIGGIWGTVVSVNNEENTFVMESEGTLIKFDKRAIYSMTLPEEAQKVEVATEEVKEEAKEEPKA